MDVSLFPFKVIVLTILDVCSLSHKGRFSEILWVQNRWFRENLFGISMREDFFTKFSSQQNQTFLYWYSFEPNQMSCTDKEYELWKLKIIGLIVFWKNNSDGRALVSIKKKFFVIFNWLGEGWNLVKSSKYTIFYFLTDVVIHGGIRMIIMDKAHWDESK